MWPFRRRATPPPAGSLRVGEHSADDGAYSVLTVSESRHPEPFAAMWVSASDSERERGRVRRWATLLPVRDPSFGVADVAVQFDGQTACFLRPPHLGRAAQQIDGAHVLTLEVPALVEWGPAGPSVRLRFDD